MLPDKERDAGERLPNKGFAGAANWDPTVESKGAERVADEGLSGLVGDLKRASFSSA